jgi:hypothetical protein
LSGSRPCRKAESSTVIAAKTVFCPWNRFSLGLVGGDSLADETTQ